MCILYIRNIQEKQGRKRPLDRVRRRDIEREGEIRERARERERDVRDI